MRIGTCSAQLPLSSPCPSASSHLCLCHGPLQSKGTLGWFTSKMLFYIKNAPFFASNMLFFCPLKMLFYIKNAPFFASKMQFYIKNAFSTPAAFMGCSWPFCGHCHVLFSSHLKYKPFLTCPCSEILFSDPETPQGWKCLGCSLLGLRTKALEQSPNEPGIAAGRGRDVLLQLCLQFLPEFF